MKIDFKRTTKMGYKKSKKMKPKHKDFLLKELPTQLRTLKENQAPNFGLMTAHHMVEHLIFVTKSIQKRKGEPEAALNKSQLYFRKFLDKGCPFEHRQKEGATLNDLRTESIEAAVAILTEATVKFYNLFETNPNHKSYNIMMGAFNLKEIELFNYQHGRWHLHQFGIIEEFAPLKL